MLTQCLWCNLCPPEGFASINSSILTTLGQRDYHYIYILQVRKLLPKEMEKFAYGLTTCKWQTWYLKTGQLAQIKDSPFLWLVNGKRWYRDCKCRLFIYFFHSSQKQSLSLYAKCWRQRGFQIMTPSFRSMHSKMQNVILSQDSPSQTAPISFSWGRLDLTGAYCIFVSLCLWYTLFLLLLQMQHVSKNIVIP